MRSQPPRGEDDEFEHFVRSIQPGLGIVLEARLGRDRGSAATSEALAWAWENWDRMQTIEHPIAYLTRVGTSRTRFRRRFPTVERPLPPEDRHFEPALDDALDSLSPRQRACVMLIAGLGYSYTEAADHLSISRSTAQQHYERGMSALRRRIEPTPPQEEP